MNASVNNIQHQLIQRASFSRNVILFDVLNKPVTSW